MSRVRNASVSFFLFLVLMCASMGFASPRTARQVPAAQESAVVGGDAGCAFAAGLAVGLDAAGLFGCLPCAVGGFLVGAGTLIACS